MTRERKMEIWKNKGPYGALRYSFARQRFAGDRVGETPTPGGITPEEEQAILDQWETLPGGASYMSAFWSLPEAD